MEETVSTGTESTRSIIDPVDEEIGFTEQASRVIARGLVISGGLFWIAGAFAGPFVYKDISLAGSLSVAVWPLMAALTTIIIGWVYERLAAELMFGSAAAVLVWGTLYAWEVGVWILMVGLLMAPMILSGILFLVAARAEIKREEASWAAEQKLRDSQPTPGFTIPRANRG